MNSLLAEGETLRSGYRIAKGFVDEVQEAAAKLLDFREGVGLTAIVDRPEDRSYRDLDRPTGREVPAAHLVMLAK